MTPGLEDVIFRIYSEQATNTLVELPPERWPDGVVPEEGSQGRAARPREPLRKRTSKLKDVSER